MPTFALVEAAGMTMADLETYTWDELIGVSIAMIGTEIKIAPAEPWKPWPDALQYSESVNGIDFDAWIDADYNDFITVSYPGYVRIKAADTGFVRYVNRKATAELTAIDITTVKTGEVITT